MKLYSFCPECGPNVALDQNGCCVPCGSTAVGSWIYENGPRVKLRVSKRPSSGGKDGSEK
jgi:hypothetical protein